MKPKTTTRWSLMQEYAPTLTAKGLTAVQMNPEPGKPIRFSNHLRDYEHVATLWETRGTIIKDRNGRRADTYLTKVDRAKGVRGENKAAFWRRFMGVLVGPITHPLPEPVDRIKGQAELFSAE